MTVLDFARRLTYTAVLLGSALVAIPASAQVVVIPPSQDNTLFENDPNASSGRGPTLFGGESGFLSRRVVIAFDVASAVPPGSTIQSVELRMNVLAAGPFAQPTDVYRLHLILAGWGEAGSNSGPTGGQGAPAQLGDATWSHRFFGTPQTWSGPGAAGDFIAASSAAAPTPTFGAAVWSSSGMVNDVQDWLDHPTSNFGWLIIGNESQTRSARRFASRESSSPPELIIEFQPPPISPPAVPDGRQGTPLLANRVTPDGSQVRLEWDVTHCDGNVDHHLIFGFGTGLPSSLGGVYDVRGGECGIGPTSPYLWTGVPDPVALDPASRLLWFLMLANDDIQTEGSWGLDSANGERDGIGPNGSSLECGMEDKDLSNICGQGCPPLDYWTTTPAAPTQIEFGSPEIPRVPQSFFFPGSDPFTGVLPLRGFPKQEGRPPVDTIVRRSAKIDLTAAPVGSQAMVDVEIVELSLVGLEPVTVTPGPDDWVIGMGLSDQQSTGLLEATKTIPTGGEAAAQIPVTPRFVFARGDDLLALQNGLIPPDQVDVRFYDFDPLAIPPVALEWAGPMPWSSEPPQDGGFFCPGETFFPGRRIDDSGLNAPCAPGALPPLVPGTGSATEIFQCPPPPPVQATCTYDLLGTAPSVVASCSAPPRGRVTRPCGPGSCGDCPPFVVVEFDGAPSNCVGFYSCAGCQ